MEDLHARLEQIERELKATLEEKKKAEQALSSSNAELQKEQALGSSLIHGLPEPALLLEPDFRVSKINRAFCEHFQLSPDEAEGKFVYDLYEGRWDTPQLRYLLEEVLPLQLSVSGVRVRQHFQFIGKRELLSAARLEPLPLVLITIRDITDQLRDEQAHRRTKDAFRTEISDILNQISDAAGIEKQVSQMLGEHLQADRVHYAEISADGKHSIVKADYSHNLPSVMGRHHLDSYGPMIMNELRTGRTLVVHNVQEDERLSPEEKENTSGLSIGAYIIVPLLREERIAAILVVHFREAHAWTQEEIRLIEKVAEQTWNAIRRLRDEEMLRKTQERLALAVEAGQMGTWELDLLHDISSWRNFRHDQIFGYQQPQKEWGAEIAKKHILAEDRNIFDNAFARAMEQGALLVEVRVCWPDKSIHWMKIQGRVFFNDEGQPVRASGVNYDITESKEAELLLKSHYVQQLEQKNKELEQFAYIASHDLQEPLRTVTNFAGVLHKQYSDQLDGRARHSLDFILSATARMRELISDLLEYSRVGRNEEKSAVDLSEEVSHLLVDMRSVMEEKHVQLDIDELPLVKASAVEMRLLFQNLITNAIKFQPPGQAPEIRIGVKDAGEFWEFSVKDNGLGIEQEYQQKVFRIFQRLHSREVFDGTGIGLAHCRKIVEHYGGSIWITSQPNKGSTFTFTLPKLA